MFQEYLRDLKRRRTDKQTDFINTSSLSWKQLNNLILKIRNSFIILHNLHNLLKSVIPYIYIYIHWSKQLNDQPVLLLSSFVHNLSINEHKNMKLKENTCYERIN